MPKPAEFDPQKKGVMRAAARVRSGGWIGSATNSLEKEEDTEVPKYMTQHHEMLRTLDDLPDDSWL